MPCYHPLKGYPSKERNPSGKRSIVFNPSQGYRDLEIDLPCGQCIGCRLERSRKWAIRCVHEASLYENNSFITLTYAPENLPAEGTLVLKHFQDFMKRLRKRFPEEKIRFFHCGEYGEKTQRPHYHACLFNFDFNDKKLLKINNDQKYYESATLQSLWPHGHSMTGAVTFESAAYVARYITKKITGEKAHEHYNTINYQTGEILAERKPEYVTMSRRPGIGKPWYEKFKTDIYPDDFVVIRGKKMSVPKVYDKYLEISDPRLYARIKSKRKVGAATHSENNTHDRLQVREEIQILKFEQLKRNYENET